MFHWSVQHGFWWGNPKLRCDSEDKNTLTESVSVDSDCADDPVSKKHEGFDLRDQKKLIWEFK